LHINLLGGGDKVGAQPPLDLRSIHD